ncbi:MAG: hypothetical protein HRT66_13845 [Flavobacteriaceae bacterium]|nr:hypothetical protein [Flavobacteriaceae bacterium]
MKKSIILVLSLLLSVLLSCTKDSDKITEVLSTEAKLSEFKFVFEEGELNINLQEDIVYNYQEIEEGIIEVLLPYGTSANYLNSSFTLSSGATSEPASETRNEYTIGEATVFTVISEDLETTMQYSVLVTIAPNTDALINSFIIEGGITTMVGNNINIIAPYDADIFAITPTITFSEGASVIPASGEDNTFYSPAIYQVTSANGVVEQYTVNVTIADDTRSTESTLISFEMTYGESTFEGDIIGQTITVSVPAETDLSTLVANATYSNNATTLPTNLLSLDFSEVQTISIVAENGTATPYIIRIVVMPKETTGLKLKEHRTKTLLYQYEYNDLNYISKETKHSISEEGIISFKHSIEYTYDVNSNVIQRNKIVAGFVDPQDGSQGSDRFDSVIKFVYNEDNQLISSTNHRASDDLDIIFSNDKYIYNELGQLTNHQSWLGKHSSSSANSITYTYDENGNGTTINKPSFGSTTASSYDNKKNPYSTSYPASFKTIIQTLGDRPIRDASINNPTMRSNYVNMEYQYNEDNYPVSLEFYYENSLGLAPKEEIYTYY